MSSLNVLDGGLKSRILDADRHEILNEIRRKYNEKDVEWIG